jgi:hypothetical protein
MEESPVPQKKRYSAALGNGSVEGSAKRTAYASSGAGRVSTPSRIGDSSADARFSNEKTVVLIENLKPFTWDGKTRMLRGRVGFISEKFSSQEKPDPIINIHVYDGVSSLHVTASGEKNVQVVLGLVVGEAYEFVVRSVSTISVGDKKYAPPGAVHKLSFYNKDNFVVNKLSEVDAGCIPCIERSLQSLAEFESLSAYACVDLSVVVLLDYGDLSFGKTVVRRLALSDESGCVVILDIPSSSIPVGTVFVSGSGGSGNNPGRLPVFSFKRLVKSFRKKERSKKDEPLFTDFFRYVNGSEFNEAVFDGKLQSITEWFARFCDEGGNPFHLNWFSEKTRLGELMFQAASTSLFESVSDINQFIETPVKPLRQMPVFKYCVAYISRIDFEKYNGTRDSPCSLIYFSCDRCKKKVNYNADKKKWICENQHESDDYSFSFRVLVDLKDHSGTAQNVVCFGDVVESMFTLNGTNLLDLTQPPFCDKKDHEAICAYIGEAIGKVSYRRMYFELEYTVKENRSVVAKTAIPEELVALVVDLV